MAEELDKNIEAAAETAAAEPASVPTPSGFPAC